MNESENDFEALRRLLALKRHEVPPPGYFNEFSSQVLASIRAGGAQPREGAAERFFEQVPWLLRILEMVQAKPVFVGSFATTMCVLLLGGIIYSERPVAVVDQPKWSMPAPTPVVASVIPTAAPSGLTLTTNVAVNLQPVASLFGQQNPLLQPVNLSLPGN